MLTRSRNNGTARGFTIMELLIAVTVFSLVLILITTGVLRFSRQYYKGVISGKTQDTARAIVDDVTRAIQYNGGAVSYVQATPTGQGVYCFGESKRYRVYLNAQVTDGTSINTSQNQARHAIVSDSPPGACTPFSGATNVKNTAALSSSNSGPNPRELLGTRMRLAKFSVNGSGNLWTIDVKVVYGDDLFLCDSNAAASSPAGCTNPNPPATLPGNVNLANVSCRTENSSQFCAVSELTTTIDKRVKRVN